MGDEKAARALHTGCNTESRRCNSRLEPAHVQEESLLLRAIISLKSLWQDESGQDVVEYALLAALIAMSVVPELHKFGTALEKDYTTIGTDFAKHKNYKL
jgi:Flp pilus assembly pilin Flp